MNMIKTIIQITETNYTPDLIKNFDVVCLNMHMCSRSFGIKVAKEIEKYNSNCALMFILEENIIRTQKIKKDTILIENDKIRIYKDNLLGDRFRFSVSHFDVMYDLKMHSFIKLSKGKVVLEIIGKGLDYIILKVIKAGKITSNSKIYIPNFKRNPLLTNKDKEDIKFASTLGVSFLTIPNVTNLNDVLKINDLIIELRNNNIGLISKIQNISDPYIIDEIIKVSDGIILTSDLAINFSFQNALQLQQDIIEKYPDKINIVEVDVKTLGFLEISYLIQIATLKPSAVIMKQPTLLKQVKEIISTAKNNFQKLPKINSIVDLLCYNIVNSLLHYDIKAVIIFDPNGYMVRLISSYRLPYFIIAICQSKMGAKSLNLNFGIIPIVVDSKNLKTLYSVAVLTAKKLLKLKNRDKVIIVGSDNNFMAIKEI